MDNFNSVRLISHILIALILLIVIICSHYTEIIEALAYRV